MLQFNKVKKQYDGKLVFSHYPSCMKLKLYFNMYMKTI